jgi:hypothetical protein
VAGAPVKARDDDVVIRLPVDARSLFRVLVTVAVTLAAVSALTQFALVAHVRLPLDQLVKRLNVDEETSIPTWFSVVQLFLCVLLLVTIAVRERGRPYARAWWWLAVGFTWLSIDEAVTFHEFVNDKMANALSSSSQVLWVVPAAITVVAVGIMFVGFLVHLPRRYGVLFLVAGGLFVFASVGLETVGGDIVDTHGGKHAERAFLNVPYVVEATAEEALEMLSVALFAYGLASYAGEQERRSVPSGVA